MSDEVAIVAGEEGISADEVILPANAADACSIPLLEPPAIARQPQDVPRPPRIGARIKCTSDSGCDLGEVLQVTEFLPGSMGGPKTGLSVQAQLCILWDPPWDLHPGNLWWHEHCDRIVVLSEPDEVERSIRRKRGATAQLGVGDRDGGGGGLVATNSAGRAAADRAVRTKPPPGWTKVMDYGKLKGYRSPDGRKAISLPAAWRLYDEQQARAAVCPPPSSAPPCTDAPPPSSRKQPVPTPSAESSATTTVAAPAPANALATALVPYFGSRTSSRRGKQPLDPAVGKRVWSWRQDLQREMAGEIMDFQFWQDRVREHFVRYEDGVSLWRPEAEWWEDEDT
jgi:hypothetical protein